MINHLELMGDVAVDRETRLPNDSFRTSPERFLGRHSVSASKTSCFVGCRTNDTPAGDATDENRQPLQLGKIPLLDGGVESIHIHVNDHFVDSHRSFSTIPILRSLRMEFSFLNHFADTIAKISLSSQVRRNL